MTSEAILSTVGSALSRQQKFVLTASRSISSEKSPSIPKVPATTVGLPVASASMAERDGPTNTSQEETNSSVLVVGPVSITTSLPAFLFTPSASSDKNSAFFPFPTITVLTFGNEERMRGVASIRSFAGRKLSSSSLPRYIRTRFSEREYSSLIFLPSDRGENFSVSMPFLTDVIHSRG